MWWYTRTQCRYVNCAVNNTEGSSMLKQNTEPRRRHDPRCSVAPVFVSSWLWKSVSQKLVFKAKCDQDLARNSFKLEYIFLGYDDTNQPRIRFLRGLPSFTRFFHDGACRENLTYTTHVFQYREATTMRMINTINLTVEGQVCRKAKCFRPSPSCPASSTICKRRPPHRNVCSQ